MKQLFPIFTMTLLMLLEFLGGNTGFLLPFAGLGVFYFAVSAHWGQAAALAVICGALTDFIYGREIPLTPLLLIGCAAFGWRWRSLRRSGGWVNLLPGTLIFGGMTVLLLSGSIFGGGAFDGGALLDILALAIVMSVVGAGSFFLLCRLLDAVGRKLGCDYYSMEESAQLAGTGHYHWGRKKR